MADIPKPSTVLILRSTLFNIAFYAVTALFVVVGSPLLLGPRKLAMTLIYKGQARASLWLLKNIAGVGMELRGLDKLPPGPVLIASKHQSAWDTFALVPYLKDPALVMKRELFMIPFLGWFSNKYKMIGVDRSAGPSALRKMARDAKERAAEGREIIIFPEGTRKAAGAPPDYKSGVVLLYDNLDIPVVPVALNSGLYWPRRSLLRYPGTIIAEILDPIPPGLARKEFMARLQGAIEPAATRLIEEAGREANPPPTAASALASSQ